MNQKTWKKMVLPYVVFVLLMSVMSGPAAAEDRDCLLFSRYTDPHWQIWIRMIDSGEEYQLTGSGTDKRHPRFVPGEASVIYRTANSRLYRFHLKDGREEPMLERLGVIMDQNVSPDGGRIAFTRMRSDILDDSDIWVSGLDGESSRKITDAPGLQWNPVWFPDGERLMYVSWPEGSRSAFALWSVDLQGGDPVQLTDSEAYDVLPAVSPDSGQAVFSSNRDGDYDIWTLDLTTKETVKLTDNTAIDTSPAYRSDGQAIAYASLQSGQFQIWQMGPDGRNRRQITGGNSPSQDPCWCAVEEDVFKIIKERSHNARE